MSNDTIMKRSKRFDWPKGSIMRLCTAKIGDQQLLLAASSPPASLKIYDIGQTKAELLTELAIGAVTDIIVHNEWCYACSAEKGVVAIELSTPAKAQVVHEWGAELPALPSSIGVIKPADTTTSHRLVVALRALPSNTDTAEDILVEGYASSAWEGPPPESARTVETEGDLGIPIIEHRFGGEQRGFKQIGYRAYPKLNQLRFVGYHQPWEVDTMGNHAFIAAGRSGLFLYDLSRLDLKEPGLEYCPGPRVRGVKAAGKHIIITGDGSMPKGEKDNGLVVLDYSNTALPTPVFPWKVDGLPPAVRCELFVSGLLVLEPKAISYYHLPDLTLLRLATRFELPEDQEAMDVAVVGGRVYVATKEGKILLLRFEQHKYMGEEPTVELLDTITIE